MNDYKVKSIYYDQVFSELRYPPNKHLVNARLKNYDHPDIFDGFTFELNRNVEETPFLTVDDLSITKLQLTSDLQFFKYKDPAFNFKLPGFQLEVYQVKKEGFDTTKDMVLLSLDELVLYLNEENNRQAKVQYGFPELHACEFEPGSFNYITASREIKNAYFTQTPGLSAALHMDFEHELKEIYAIATNNLAFLYRTKDRVFEEITSLKNERYNLGFHIYPRFNNAVSEVASSLYSLWERIAFILNAFFAADPTNSLTPSFKSYIIKKRKIVNQDAAYNTDSFKWLNARIGDQHERLSELRHPMIHYNERRNPPGMRSVELLKVRRRELNDAELMSKWSDELEFLKQELSQVSVGLEKAVNLVREWAQLQS